MSAIGGGRSTAGRLEPATVGGVDAGAAASGTTAVDGAAATTSTVRRGGGGDRLRAAAGLGAGAPADLVELAGTSAGIRPDGAIVPVAAGAAGGPLAALAELALASAQANPFAGVTDPVLLGKVADRLVETHKGLLGTPPDDATTLAWRQSRASALCLLEQVALQAKAIGKPALVKETLDDLVGALADEPWRAVRDFAYESLVARAEKKELPKVESAREALYPSAPPYDKWLANGRIDVRMICDDDGSKIADQIEYFTSYLGFKHKDNGDGSHTLTLAKRGQQPPIVITIPPKQDPPALFDKMDDPETDVVCYMGHAGYGHRVDHAIANGVGGTGDGKAVLLFQCWGEGNVESLERAYPDAQVLSTTDATTDGMDWVMWESLVEGFRNKEGWKAIDDRTTVSLKREFRGESDYKDKDWDGHYFTPVTRSLLVKHYDRDGDGSPDESDHIFNVVYPKRADAAGGYDPVVQPIPTYALDGSGLSRSVADLSLAIRYTKMLPPAVEARLPWKPELWRPGGFFEPAAGDNRAFQFEKRADGSVGVQLSTRFAHATQEDLSRMLAYESGLWLASEAGLAAADRVALGLALAERIVHQQGAWYGTATSLLDEPWAEEQLFQRRYGLSGFTFAELEHEVGDPDEYKPEHFARIAAKARALPGAAGLAEREPTAVGEPIDLGGRDLKLEGYFDLDQVSTIVKSLGIDGEVVSTSPSWIDAGQPANLVALCRKGDDTFQVSFGVDSTGAIHTASRLDLDLARKLDADLARILVSSLEGGANPDAARAVQSAFTGARAAGKDLETAFAAGLDALRRALPPGSHGPGAYEVSELERQGFITPSASAAMTRRAEELFRGAYAEEAIFGWLRSAGAGRVDVDKLAADYTTALIAGGGTIEGNAKALEALLRAVPDGLGKGDAELVGLLACLGQNALVPADKLAPLQALLRAKVGVDGGLLAGTVVKHLVSGDEAALARIADRVEAEVRGGAAVVPALLAGLDRAYAESGAVVQEYGLDVATHLGVVAKGSPEEAELRRAIAERAATQRALGSLANAVAPAGSYPEQGGPLHQELMRLVAANGGDHRAAAAAFVKAHPALTNPTSLIGALQIVPAADRSAFAAELLAAAGTTTAGLVRTSFAASLTEMRSWDGISAADERAALQAFDRALARGGLGEAIGAFAATVGSRGDHGIDAFELLALIDPAEVSKALPGAEVAACLSDLLGNYGADDADVKRGAKLVADRFVAGAAPGEALAAGFEAVPAATWRRLREDGALGSIVSALGEVSGGGGREALGVVQRALSLSDADLAFAVLASDLDVDPGSAEEARARTAFDSAVRAGRSVGEALAEALRAYGGDAVYGTDGTRMLARHGIITPTEAGAVSALTNTGQSSAREMATAFAMHLGMGERAGAMTDAVTAALGQGGPRAAIDALLAETRGAAVPAEPPQLWPDLSLLAGVPEPDRQRLSAELGARLGIGSEAARAGKVLENYMRVHTSSASGGQALLDAAIARAGGDVGAGVVDAFRAAGGDPRQLGAMLRLLAETGVITEEAASRLGG